MPYVRDSFWRGRSWESVEQMKTAAEVWCVEVAGQRRHRSLDGAAPYAVFQAVERRAMRELPVAAFELARWSTPKVDVDCHVSVAGVLYSVPGEADASTPVSAPGRSKCSSTGSW